MFRETILRSTALHGRIFTPPRISGRQRNNECRVYRLWQNLQQVSSGLGAIEKAIRFWMS